MLLSDLKLCTDCGTEKPLSLFSSAGQGGRLRPQCKPCTREREKSQIAARRAAEGLCPATRVCSKCQQEKSLTTEFFKKRESGAFGFTSECKKCLGARNLKWSKTEAGRANAKRYRDAHPEKHRESARRYVAANRDKCNEYARAYRLKNIERARELARQFAKRAKAKRTAYRHMRRAAGEFSYEVVSELRELQKNKCATCRKPFTSLVEVDHIIPIALGGTNAKHNLQLLCRFCNRSKGAKHPVDFMQSMGYLL
jgi:5-methylcytosine-specific restriction endonuclease McrA